MLHNLVIESAARYSQQVCVVFDSGEGEAIEQQRITYAQLGQQITELKVAFEDLSLKEQIVGVLLADGPTIPSVLIGLLSSSCAFFPINYEGLQYTTTALMKASVSHILAHSELIERLSPLLKQLNGSQIQSVVLSKNGLQLFRLEHISFPAVSLVKLHGLAYCITTSGTTSAPKMVYVPHSCIMPNIIHLRNIFQLGINDRVLLTSPLTFDPSIVDIFSTLSSGACLVIVPSEVKRRPEKLLNIIHHRQAVTVMQATSTLMRSFPSSKLQHTLFGPNSALRVLALGGEKFPSRHDLMGWFSAENTTTQCYNLYGITEVSCWASCQNVDVRTIEKDEPVPIGVALDETIIKLMPSGSDGDIHDSDVDGDIWIGSDKRFCFIDNEVYESSQDRCSRLVMEKPEIVWRATGDRGKMLPDGSILCLGRRDDQVKRHGKRLNLEAVEMVCREIKGVLDCCALLDQSNLMVFIKIDSPTGEEESYEDQSALNNINNKLLPEHARDEGKSSVHQHDTCWAQVKQRLKVHIEDSLPSHYWPNVFVKISGSFPLTQNGKLDKKWLIKKGNAEMKAEFETDITNARTFSEEIWKAHLPDSVIITNSDNFISLGGDSLAALRVINTLEHVFSCRLPNLLDLLFNKDFVLFVEELQKYLDLRLSDLKPPYLALSENVSDSFVTSNLPVILSHGRSQGQRTVHEMEQMPNINLTSTEKEDTHSIKSKHKLVLPETSESKKSKFINLTTSDGAELASDENHDLNFISSSVQSNGNSELLKKAYNDSSINSVQKSGNANISPPFHSDIDIISEIKLTRILSRGKIWLNHSYSGNVECSRNVTELTSTCISKSCRGGSMEPCVPGHISSDEPVSLTLGTAFELSLRWKFDTKQCVDASPLIVEQTGRMLTFIGSHSGQFSAINILTGRSVWSVTLPDRIESTACCSQCGAFVIVGCYDGHIYVLDLASGSIFWKFLTHDSVKCSPVVDSCKGFVVCGSHDGFLYCLDLKVRDCVWKCHMGGGSVFSSPVIDVSARLVYAASLAGKVFCICADSGTIQWACELHKSVFSSLCLHGQSVLVGCVDGKLYCIAASGHIEWTFVTQGPIFSTPIVHNSSVLVGCHDHHVYCLTQAGQLVWSFQTSSPVYSTAFASVVITCIENTKETSSINNKDNSKESGSIKIIENTMESYSKNDIKNIESFSFNTQESCVIQNIEITEKSCSIKAIEYSKQSGTIKNIKNTKEPYSFANTENTESCSSQLIENTKESGSSQHIAHTESCSSQHIANTESCSSQKVENTKKSCSSQHIENISEICSSQHNESTKEFYSSQHTKSTSDLQYKTILSSGSLPEPLCSIVIAASTDGTLYVISLNDGLLQTKIKLPGEIFSSPVIIDNFVVVGCRDNFVYCFEVT